MFKALKVAALPSLNNIRNYSARAVYVANLTPETSKEQLVEFFSMYGKISGIRTKQTGPSYKYAHVYFSVGEYDTSDGKLPDLMRDQNATPEEIEKCESIVNEVVKATNGAMINDSIIQVHPSIYKTPEQLKDRMENRNGQRNGVNLDHYNRGFAEGYRKGVTDGMRMGKSQ